MVVKKAGMACCMSATLPAWSWAVTRWYALPQSTVSCFTKYFD